MIVHTVRVCATCDKPLDCDTTATAKGKNPWLHADESTDHEATAKAQCPNCGSTNWTSRKAKAGAEKFVCKNCKHADHPDMLLIERPA